MDKLNKFVFYLSALRPRVAFICRFRMLPSYTVEDWPILDDKDVPDLTVEPKKDKRFKADNKKVEILG